MENSRWRDEMAKVLDITQPFGKLMAVQQEAERLQHLEQEDPSEEDYFEQIYEGMEFIDDVSGEPLERADAIAARKVEIKYFKDMGVYTNVKREAWMKIISTKWLDVNKGDSLNNNYRARLVGREIKRDRRDDLFAATPPLESLRMILSVCASNQHTKNPCDNFIVMTSDEKRAYFHAPVNPKG